MYMTRSQIRAANFVGICSKCATTGLTIPGATPHTALAGKPDSRVDLTNSAWQLTGSWVLTGEDAGYKGVVNEYDDSQGYQEGHWQNLCYEYIKDPGVHFTLADEIRIGDRRLALHAATGAAGELPCRCG